MQARARKEIACFNAREEIGAKGGNSGVGTRDRGSHIVANISNPSRDALQCDGKRCALMDSSEGIASTWGCRGDVC